MTRNQHGQMVRAEAHRLVLVLAVVGTVGLLAGCTATAGAEVPSAGVTGTGPGAAAAAEAPAATSPTPGTTGLPCGTATPELMADIAVSARPEGTFTPLTGAFVEADNGIYVVAVRFEGVDAEVLEGVWTAVGVDPATPPYLSADEDANLYTAWDTVLGMPGFGVALDDPAIPAALRCLPR